MSTNPSKRNLYPVKVRAKDGEIIRSATIVQARNLVLRGEAVPTTQDGGELPGWQGRQWADWPGIKLVNPRSDTQSPCCLTEGDAHLVAGEEGQSPAAKRAIERVDNWDKVHDLNAVTVIAGGEIWIPDEGAAKKRAELQFRLHLQARAIEQAQARRAFANRRGDHA